MLSQARLARGIKGQFIEPLNELKNIERHSFEINRRVRQGDRLRTRVVGLVYPLPRLSRAGVNPAPTIKESNSPPPQPTNVGQHWVRLVEASHDINKRGSLIDEGSPDRECDLVGKNSVVPVDCRQA